MKQALVVLSLFLFSLVPLTGAGASKKAPIRWIESNGEIVLDSVCDEFAYGSIDYRNCRAAAKRLFEERCREYQQSADKTGGALREKNQQKRDMFCTASSQFGAVN